MGTREFLIFGIGKENYGVDILTVREIRSYTEPTKMANSPLWFKGIIDLRGVVIPIIDTRIKFNLDHYEYNDSTIVIVITKGDQDYGLVVDRVVEVDAFTDAEIQVPPHMENSAVNANTITGLANREGKELTILINSSMFISDMQS